MRKSLPEDKANFLHLDWGFIDESANPLILHKALYKALKKRKFSVLQYGDNYGLSELRELFLILLREKFGIKNITKDNICITSGATAGIDLISRHILRKKYDSVILEPVYDTAIESLLLNSKRVLAIEFDPFSNKVFDLSKLEKALAKKNTKLLYLNPNFQNPTGITIDLLTRIKILKLCQKYKVWILEDDPYKLYNFEKMSLPDNFINLDQTRQNTIYINSLSKISFPGLRVGVVVVDKSLIKGIAEIQKYTISSPNLMSQGIVIELFKDKSIDKLINLYYKNIKEKRDLLFKYLSEYGINNYMDYVNAQGGFYLWGRTKKNINTDLFLPLSKQKGVSFVPGSIYFLKKNKHQFLRLAYSRIAAEDIKQAVLALKEAFEHN